MSAPLARRPAWRARLDRLIEPARSVEGAEARRRSRYTALFLTILIPLGALAAALTVLLPGAAPPPLGPQLWIMTGTVALLVGLYPVSLSRRYVVASYLAILVTSAAIWGAWLLALPSTGGGMTLFFLALPIFMASLLLGSWGAALIAGVNVLGASAVAVLLAPAAGGLGNALTLPFFLFLASGLIVNSALLRERDLEELERMAARLREQEALRVQMLNTLAHDLATPLTPLKLQMSLIPADRAVPPERVVLLRRNLAQMERLVADIKDLARLEAGALRCDPQPVDLRALAQSAVDAFRADAEARGLTLLARLDAGLPVQADPERVTQVLYNLLTNALKFTPSGGTVTLEGCAEEGEARLRVRDTGRGLTPDEMGRLFHPFTQVHERGEVKERGSGLGLYISRGLAEAHGGRVWVESEGRGKGAAFTLALPQREG